MITLTAGDENVTIDAGVVPAPTGPAVVPVSPILPGPGSITNPPVVPGVPASPLTSVAVDTPPLALTGSSTNVLATLAIAVMGAGGALLIGTRRNRDDEDWS